MNQMSPEKKREMLARLLHERIAKHRLALAEQVGKDDGARPVTVGEAPLRRIPRGGDLPLSFGQERIWFLEQLLPEGLFYNVTERFGLSGRLDVELLRRSIEALIRRHEVLRTTYPSVDGRPVQRIGPPAPPHFQVVDLRSSIDRDDEARRLILAQAKTPFDLAAGPLLRTLLLQLADEDCILAVTVHHIAIDGWSLRLFMQELAAFYSAFVETREPNLPVLPVQYADFADWHRRWLDGDLLAKQRSYWLDHLGSQPPTLNLRTDYVRPSVRKFDGATCYSVIAPGLFRKLRELSREQGVTLFTTLLASFSTLLMRYTGQDDFILGTLNAGRVRPEIEPLMGFFANTLALRIDLSGNPTFREVLARTHKVVVGAYEHGAFPFDRLVEELKPERGMDRNPLAQVFLNMLNLWKRDELAFSDLRVRSLGGLDIHAVADEITLFVAEGHDSADLCYVYSTELFSAKTIERMAEHFLTLLGTLAANPDERIGTAALMAEGERKTVEKISAGAGLSFAVTAPLHRLFEAQVRMRPDAVAVSCCDAHLSYADLNRRANSVGRELRKLGVGPNTVVGLCVERTLDLAIGVLGILKAGGAYVPLDPRDPQDRLSFILGDAGVTTVVTRHQTQGALPEMRGIKMLLLEEALANVESAPIDDIVGGSRSDDLAYIIYTSGSTGQPKGVLITHANVVRLFLSSEAWFNFGHTDVWALFHSIAFDFSVWEFWGPLLYGGRLVIVPFAISRDPREFLSLLAHEGVTVLNQTPSAFRQLIEEDRIAEPQISTSLRTVIFGGEALDLHTLRGWVERHGDMKPRLVNMYGITETCVHVTYRTITRRDIETNTPSVGIPLPDLRIRLLDGHGQLVPIGVPGEIYVGGAGLAKGYLNRPALTAERFVHDTSRPGNDRLYRSGDLGRWSESGELEYLGRIDQQVKIRGFRVEPGEIEAVLTEHSQVREAAVVLRSISGDDHLLAYVVCTNMSEPNAREELRAFLKDRLPIYMQPRSIEFLRSLPLNRNGKVDYRALPAPTLSINSSSRAAGSPTEERVVGIWSEVLGITGVGPNDNFFEQGGQSLLAVRVTARLRDEFRIDLSVGRLFELQTAALLAEHIDTVRGQSASTGQGGTDRMPTLRRISRDSVRRPINVTETPSGDDQ
jgi:amino acid adenylation domain-containing protein